MDALDGSRLGRAGRVVFALASVEPVALLAVVSILTTKSLDSCRSAFEGGSGFPTEVTIEENRLVWASGDVSASGVEGDVWRRIDHD